MGKCCDLRDGFSPEQHKTDQIWGRSCPPLRGRCTSGEGCWSCRSRSPPLRLPEAHRNCTTSARVPPSPRLEPAFDTPHMNTFPWIHTSIYSFLTPIHSDFEYKSKVCSIRHYFICVCTYENINITMYVRHILYTKILFKFLLTDSIRAERC